MMKDETSEAEQIDCSPLDTLSSSRLASVTFPQPAFAESIAATLILFFL